LKLIGVGPAIADAVELIEAELEALEEATLPAAGGDFTLLGRTEPAAAAAAAAACC